MSAPYIDPETKRTLIWLVLCTAVQLIVIYTILRSTPTGLAPATLPPAVVPDPAPSEASDG